jgi:hypothetical protein
MPRLCKYKYEEFDPVISTIKKQSDNIPVYGYNHLFYQLIYYYGQPIPPIEDKEVEGMVLKETPFILIAENKHWNQLKGLDLSILIEYRPFIHKNRAVSVYSFQNKTRPPDKPGELRPEADTVK